MPLVSLNEILKDAQKRNYAVPGFNFHLYEDLKAIIKGAEEMRSPVIIMASGSCIRHWGPKLAAEIVIELANMAKIPVVAHLDHASDMSLIFKAMKAGFTSVMYDGSLLPLEENISNTKIVVKVAKSLGISVEAEVGRVGKSEEGEDVSEILTDPMVAVKFVEETEVDALAVAVGTVHGMQKQSANLNMDLCKELSRVVPVPLVLHGSSGVKNSDLIELSTKTNFRKINIGTRLKTVYMNRIREILKNDPALKNPLLLMEEASSAVTETVKEKISFLGSANKA